MAEARRPYAGHRITVNNMTRYMYIVFLSIFFLDFLTLNVGVIPRAVALVPEILAVVAAVVVALRVAHDKTLVVHPKYVLLFAMFCLHIVAGIALNFVQPGVVIAGLRNYLKYAPFFLLPAVYKVSDKAFKNQLIFLLALGLLQLPLVLAQSFVLRLHPDRVAGTLNISSVLSIFLIAALAVLMAVYIRGRIRASTFFVLALLLFIPSLFGETKSTLLLLPAAIVTVSVLASRGRKAGKKIIGVVVLGTALLGLFVLAYSVFLADPGGQRGVGEFFSEPETGVEHYLYSDTVNKINPERVLRTEPEVIGARPEVEPGKIRVARIDSILLPIYSFSNDWSKLVFGLGIGNASSSFVQSSSGQYAQLGELNVSAPALSIMLWEIGAIGVLYFLLFFALIFSDAKALARTDGLAGVFSIGWAGVVVVVVLSLPYKNFMIFNVLGILFWYMSGYVAFNRASLSYRAAEVTPMQDRN